jgi:hypothetical protein
MVEINYDALFKKAKKEIKRDLKKEQEYLENAVAMKVSRKQRLFCEHFCDYNRKILELHQQGHHILVDQCDRLRFGQALVYELSDEEFEKAKSEYAKVVQKQLDDEFNAKVSEIVNALAIEFEKEQQRKIEAESQAVSEKIRAAIMAKILEQ